MNLRCRDREINEQSHGPYVLAALIQPSFQLPFCLFINPCFVSLVDLYPFHAKSLKSSCLWAQREDSPCRCQDFTWERMPTWLVNRCRNGIDYDMRDSPLRAPSTRNRKESHLELDIRDEERWPLAAVAKSTPVRDIAERERKSTAT